MERDPAALSSRCGVCHTPGSCRQGRDNCAGCHMPVAQSKLIAVQTYRTHRIAVYK
jgi:hypothetical protein